MSYSIVEISDEHLWETFMRDRRPHSFLQSWKWSLQYEQSGSRVFRVGVYEASALVAIALFIKIEARRGSFLLCPHGPLISPTQQEETILEFLTAHTVKIGRQEKCDFIRICPLIERSEKNRLLYKQNGFRRAPIHMHPERSWMLDITKDERTLLKEMRKTTRYLIKNSEK